MKKGEIMNHNLELYKYFIEDVEVTADDLACYLRQLEMCRLSGLGTPFETNAIDGYKLLQQAIDTFEKCNALGRYNFYVDTIAGQKKYSIDLKYMAYIDRNKQIQDVDGMIENIIRYGYISKGLNNKDREIIAMKLNGYSDREIADRFHISLNQASHLFNQALWKIKRNHQQLAQSLKERK